MLVPQLNYSFQATVESLDDLGRAEDIHVFVVKKGNPVPLITAVINMPLSENVIIIWELVVVKKRQATQSQS